MAGNNDKYKAHTRYFNKAGKRLPGVTTITGKQLGWNTDTLGRWHNRMGLEGIDTQKYVDDKAKIGSLGHELVVAWLRKVEAELADYTPNQVKEAEISLGKYVEWAEKHKVEPILIEEPMVSEKYQYGGTLDFYGKVDGLHELNDLKTGSGIYDEHLVQVSAYAQLLIEAGHRVDRVRIINIPRTKEEPFLDPDVTALMKTCFKIFVRARNNHTDYNYLKRMRGRS